MSTPSRCWCGNGPLEEFSPEYRRCPACATLVSQKFPGGKQQTATPGEKDLYGRDYWFAHQTQDLHQPDIVARARLDLTERGLHWLRATLKYKLPPGRTLELGSAHGAFVALLHWVGFQATGLEVDPWIVGFAQETFQVSMLLGPIEKQTLSPHSLDIIFLFDVLEHLPDPEGTIRHCLPLLKNDGIFILQTPSFPEIAYAELKAQKHRFLEMMIPEEHLYLFSPASIPELFRRLGFTHLQFEPAIFAHYDMFLCAGQAPFSAHSQKEIDQVLSASPNGRMIQALLDTHNNLQSLAEKYAASEADRAARLEVIQRSREHIETLEEERTLNLEKIDHLTKKLEEERTLKEEAQSVLEALRGGKVFRILRKVGLWKGMEELMIGALSPPEHENPIPPVQTSERIIAGQDVSLKRIAVDLTPLLPGGENGGAKLLSLELVRHLSRLHPECEFVLLTSSLSHEEIAHLDSANVRRSCVKQVSPGPSPSQVLKWRKLRIRMREFLIGALPPSILFRLKRIYRTSRSHRIISEGILRGLNVDLLFCPFTLPLYYDPSIPAVSIIYDLQYHYYPQFFDYEDREIRERNFREACRRADRLVCISDYVRESVLKNSNKAPEHVIAIPIRLYDHMKKPPRERIAPFLSRQGLQENEFLLYPANFWPHKNHPMLLTAFGLFRFRHPDSALRLVCTGAPGARMSLIQEAARRMGLDSWVLFPGFLNEEEFSILLSACRALIFPSLYEGFGMPVLEAMSFGKPVLCANVTSLPEVAGEAALLFDPRKPDEVYKAISSIYFNSLLYEKLVTLGYCHLDRWGNAPQMAREYWKVFQNALSGNRQFSEAIHGVFPDGWTQDRVFVTFNGSAEKRTLEIQFEVPSYWPHREVSVTLSDGKIPFKTQILHRGKRTMIRHSLPEDAGILEFTFAPKFQPKDYGLNEDERILGCMCPTCSILSGGQRKSLIPPETMNTGG